LLILILLLISLSLYAQNLDNPQETMRTFVEAMDRVKSGELSAIKEAVVTLDLSEIDMGSRPTIGKLTAERLINTIDRISKINFETIPTHRDGSPWYYRKQSINVAGNIHDVEIAIYKTKDGWKFTPQTVSSIEDYYHSVENLKVVEGVVALTSWKTKFKNQFPKWTGERFFVLKNGQWFGLFGTFLLGALVYFITRFLVSLYFRNNIEAKERYKSTLPFGLLSFTIVVKTFVIFLELDIEILEVILRINYIFLATTAVWTALKLVDYLSYSFEHKAMISANKFDDVLVPMLKKTAKVLVVAFGALFVAHSLTFDVASILAGLGIGGVAVALAAKDTISNLFGSVTVILDRPFSIGDYIVLDKIEGTVEQVGFRSTRIRTPINSLVTMPNSVLANLAIDNYGMRNFRRFRTLLQIEYSTSFDKIESFLEQVRYMINLNPKIEKSEMGTVVQVFELGESSINILVNVYLIAENNASELQERHNILMEIMRIAKEYGVEFAYPTRTLYMKKEL
jgi:MscS family membrane protein